MRFPSPGDLNKVTKTQPEVEEDIPSLNTNSSGGMGGGTLDITS